MIIGVHCIQVECKVYIVPDIMLKFYMLLIILKRVEVIFKQTLIPYQAMLFKCIFTYTTYKASSIVVIFNFILMKITFTF